MFFDTRPVASVPIEPIVEALSRSLARRGGAAPALVRARLADAYRDAGVEPASSRAFRGLDEAGWGRLALFVRDPLPLVAPHLAALVGRRDADAHVLAGFTEPARTRALLTPVVLGSSRARVEELARAWTGGLGLGIDGETTRESKARLEALDYSVLLARVERAKLSAEERVEYLRKLQEAQVAGVRRGKW